MTPFSSGELRFVTLSREQDASPVLAMMRSLYVEDPPTRPVDPARFPATIDLLLSEPARGSVILFEEETRLIGYAILIPFWSNELGGTILYVDELFVARPARNQGVAHRFFEFLNRTRPFEARAISLEVSPGNARAERLYESIGFTRRRNATLLWRL